MQRTGLWRRGSLWKYDSLRWQDTEKVRIGVIGVKGIGRTHIKGIASAEDAELLAVADIDEEAGKSVSSSCGVEWYQDYEKMLELDELDAVTICTPHFLHCPMTLNALDHDKHVLVEKPMAITVSEADKMVTKAREKGLKFGVVFQGRTAPINQEIKQLIEADEIGRIYRVSMEVCDFRTQAYYDSGAWRGKWATEGGGVLINQGIHHLDLLQWFVGKPAKIHGQTGTMYHDVEVEDIASATILFENGAQGILQVGIVDPIRTSRLEICGEKGKIEKFEGARQAILKKPLREYVAEKKVWDATQEFQWAEIKPETEAVDGHNAVIQDFVRSILDDREPLISGEEGRTSLEIVNAIILSSYEGKAVSFPVDRHAYDRLMADLRKRA